MILQNKEVVINGDVIYDGCLIIVMRGGMKKIVLVILIVLGVTGVSTYTQNLVPLSVNKQYCFIDEHGTMIIPPMFDDAKKFSDGLAVVEMSEEQFVINKKGEKIFQISTDSKDAFSEGKLGVRIDGKWGYVDKNGDVVIEPNWDYVRSFSNGYALVKTDAGKYTYINHAGESINNELYDTAYSFNEKLAVVGKKVTDSYYEQVPGRTARRKVTGIRKGVINVKGELVIPYKFRITDAQFSDELLLVISKNDDHLTGYINKNGRFEIAPQFENAGRFVNGIAPATTDRLYGFIDKKGNFLVPEQFVELHSLSEGVSVFKKNGRYGYINKHGDIVIDNVFTFAASFENGLAFFRKGTDHGYINHKGEVFWSTDYYDEN